MGKKEKELPETKLSAAGAQAGTMKIVVEDPSVFKPGQLVTIGDEINEVDVVGSKESIKLCHIIKASYPAGTVVRQVQEDVADPHHVHRHKVHEERGTMALIFACCSLRGRDEDMPRARGAPPMPAPVVQAPPEQVPANPPPQSQVQVTIAPPVIRHHAPPSYAGSQYSGGSYEVPPNGSRFAQEPLTLPPPSTLGPSARPPAVENSAARVCSSHCNTGVATSFQPVHCFSEPVASPQPANGFDPYLEGYKAGLRAASPPPPPTGSKAGPLIQNHSFQSNQSGSAPPSTFSQDERYGSSAASPPCMRGESGAMPSTASNSDPIFPRTQPLGGELPPVRRY